jgi:hypothetical protein
MQYAIVEQDERRIELFTRADNNWTDEIVQGKGVLNLSSIGVEISLDLRGTELDATPQPAGETQPRGL